MVGAVRALGKRFKLMAAIAFVDSDHAIPDEFSITAIRRLTSYYAAPSLSLI
jgi:hypothetical protein